MRVYMRAHIICIFTYEKLLSQETKYIFKYTPVLFACLCFVWNNNGLLHLVLLVLDHDILMYIWNIVDMYIIHHSILHAEMQK